MNFSMADGRFGGAFLENLASGAEFIVDVSERRIADGYYALKSYAFYNWAARRPMPRRGERHKLGAPLIVSLTSYPPRFATLPATIRALLSQTVSPDLVVLWIAHADWSKLPKSVLSLQGKEFSIRATDDIKSYKKIIPALLEYEDSFIVTADDDIYYAPSWLEELLSSYDAHAGIPCHRAHKIVLDAEGNLLPYHAWKIDTGERDASQLIFPTSGAGVLYPPGTFHKDVTNVELFTSLAPTADDVWLYWMARLNGRCFRRIGKPARLLSWPGSQRETLWAFNERPDRGNDAQIGRLVMKYGFPA